MIDKIMFGFAYVLLGLMGLVIVSLWVSLVVWIIVNLWK
jgi:CHASE3 domain sensor protein